MLKKVVSSVLITSMMWMSNFTGIIKAPVGSITPITSKASYAMESVVQSAAEDEEFNLKEYIDENPSNNESLGNNKKRTYYDIDAVLDVNNKTLKGHERIRYINRQNVKLEDMAIHLYVDSYNAEKTGGSNFGGEKLDKKTEGDIKITEVVVDGKNVQFTEEEEILKFKLPAKSRRNQKINIAIDFEVKVPKSMGRLGYVDNNFSFTNWYPIVSMYNAEKKSWDLNPFHPVGESNYADYADYKVAIDVPKDMVVVGTGIEKEKKNGERKKVIMTEENVKDFAFFASPLYEVVSEKVGDIEINSYYLSGRDNVAKRFLYDDVEAMKFYNKALGKYPYKEFDIVETYMRGGAMEYPTVIQMGSYEGADMVPEKPISSELAWADDAVVHELVHQWWFGIVGNDEFSESILDESFTTFWTTLYFEYAYGPKNTRSMKNLCDIEDYYFKKDLPINRPVDKYDNEMQFYTNAYDGGAMVLQDLRQRVGSEKFIKVFRKYYDTFKFKNATLDGFLSVVEDVCGKEMRQYIKDAYTGTDYDVNSVFHPKQN